MNILSTEGSHAIWLDGGVQLYYAVGRIFSTDGKMADCFILSSDCQPVSCLGSHALDENS